MFRAICARNIFSSINRSVYKTPCRNFDFYEPSYLDELKPKFPIYEAINVQIRGYNYPVLEKYQQFLNRMAESMDLEVEDGWANPGQKFVITKLKDRSQIIESEYYLTLHERNIQITNIAASFYPIFLRLAQAAIPEGVTLNIHEHERQHDEIRFVPDNDLKELKAQLEELGGPRKKKRKKK